MPFAPVIMFMLFEGVSSSDKRRKGSPLLKGIEFTEVAYLFGAMVLFFHGVASGQDSGSSFASVPRKARQFSEFQNKMVICSHPIFKHAMDF